MPLGCREVWFVESVSGCICSSPVWPSVTSPFRGCFAAGWSSGGAKDGRFRFLEGDFGFEEEEEGGGGVGDPAGPGVPSWPKSIGRSLDEHRLSAATKTRNAPVDSE